MKYIFRQIQLVAGLTEFQERMLREKSGTNRSGTLDAIRIYDYALTLD